jgi:hypothetical protein
MMSEPFYGSLTNKNKLLLRLPVHVKMLKPGQCLFFDLQKGKKRVNSFNVSSAMAFLANKRHLPVISSPLFP